MTKNQERCIKRQGQMEFVAVSRVGSKAMNKAEKVKVSDTTMLRKVTNDRPKKLLRLGHALR
jgi:hypothetical protein